MKSSILALGTVGLLALASTATAADLDSVLNGYYESSGGLDAMNAVKSSKATGNSMFPGGIEAPFTIYFEPQEHHMRLEINIQGMTMVQAYDGETAWAIQPFLGKTTPESLAGEEAKQIKDQADFFGPLVNYQAKGHQLEYLGETDVDGTSAHEIKVTKQGGNIEHYFLDTEYHLPFRVEGSMEIQGQSMSYTAELGDYKEVGSMVVPHSIATSFGLEGQQVTQRIVIENMELNPELDSSIFVMPTGESADS